MQISYQSTRDLSSDDQAVLSRWVYYDELYSKTIKVARRYREMRNTCQDQVGRVLSGMPEQKLEVNGRSEYDVEHLHRYGSAACMHAKTVPYRIPLSFKLVRTVLEETLKEILEEECSESQVRHDPMSLLEAGLLPLPSSASGGGGGGDVQDLLPPAPLKFHTTVEQVQRVVERVLKELQCYVQTPDYVTKIRRASSKNSVSKSITYMVDELARVLEHTAVPSSSPALSPIQEVEEEQTRAPPASPMPLPVPISPSCSGLSPSFDHLRLSSSPLR